MSLVADAPVGRSGQAEPGNEPLGLSLAKAGFFARHEAQVVAQKIAARVTGEGQTGPSSGHGKYFIEIGGGKAGLGPGNFYDEPNPAVKNVRAGPLAACPSTMGGHAQNGILP